MQVEKADRDADKKRRTVSSQRRRTGRQGRMRTCRHVKMADRLASIKAERQARSDGGHASRYRRRTCRVL
jgi:hypothetical protein